MTQRATNNRKLGSKLIFATTGILVAFGLLAFRPIGASQIRGLATQARGAPLPSFEVASIKLCKSRSPLPGIHLFNDRFNATATAFMLIKNAFGHDRHQLSAEEISGGPDWIKSQLFEINAKVDDSLVESAWKNASFQQKYWQTMPMVQSLLLDRFKLEVRHETKVLPVWELTLGKGGPKFKEDDPSLHPSMTYFHGLGKLDITSTSLIEFGSWISFQPELGDRVVLDKTGLKGYYTFALRWVPESPAAGNSQSGGGASSSESSGPSLFTALQEQLGLRLVPAKAPVDVLVIDSIERPSED